MGVVERSGKLAGRCGRRTRVALRIAVLGLCLLALAPPAWSADLPEPALARIGPGVLEALAQGGGANVMIAFREPAAAAAPRRSTAAMASLRSEVARMQDGLLSQLAPAGFRARHRFAAVPAMAGRVLDRAALEPIALDPSVLRIDLDEGGRGALETSVPFIGADQRHAGGNTGAGVVVAVLDSGLDRDHDNLGDSLLAEACFLDGDGAIDGRGGCPNGSDRQLGPGSAEDDAGHGSHVTGIITSNGMRGGAGVAPNAGIVAIKVTEGPTFSGAFAFFSEIVAALDFLIANPQLNVQVINMSLVTTAMFSGDCDAASAGTMAAASAIHTLRERGVIAFAAAGNDGSGTQMTAPACLREVISVGASDETDRIAAFSDANASTDLFAPGVNILSSNLGNTTVLSSGTSMASPHAAGCAALLIESGEAVTPDAIEQRLEASAFRVRDPRNGLSFPRLDCRLEAAPADGDADGVTDASDTCPVTPEDAVIRPDGCALGDLCPCVSSRLVHRVRRQQCVLHEGVAFRRLGLLGPKQILAASLEALFEHCPLHA